VPFPELLGEAGVQCITCEEHGHATGEDLPARPRPGHLELAQHRLRSRRAIVAMAQREFRQIFPRPGWVEHDPREIWESQLATAREALAKAGSAPPTSRRSASPTSARRRCSGTGAAASRSPTRSSGRTGAPRRRARR
jgi:hypothetical protein